MAAHVDGPHVMEATRRALARAGRKIEIWEIAHFARNKTEVVYAHQTTI